MIDDSFPIEKVKELATAAQLETLDESVAFGWEATHIAEYQIGFLGIWLISDHHKTVANINRYSFAVIDVEGTLLRIPKKAKRGKQDGEWYDEA